MISYKYLAWLIEEAEAEEEKANLPQFLKKVLFLGFHSFVLCFKQTY